MIRSEHNSKGSRVKALRHGLWGFHARVLFLVTAGAAIVAAANRWPLPPRLRDFSVWLGGVLIGLIALPLNEWIHGRPERRRLEKLREEDRRQHEQEIDEAHQKFLTLETELSVAKSRAADLLAQLELVGSHTRSLIYSALMLGYFHDRHEDQLESLPPSFDVMARKLDLPPHLLETEDLPAFIANVGNALEARYGPVIHAAFDLGRLLRDLDRRGFEAMCHPDAAAYLVSGLKALKCDPGIIAATARFFRACEAAQCVPDEASHFFHHLLLVVSGRFLEVARSPDKDDALRNSIENPIRIPKSVRVENVTIPENGKWTRVMICGRPIVITNAGGSLVACDLEDMPTDEERRWRAGVRPVRSYAVRAEANAIVLERKWGYADERPPRLRVSVAPPPDSRDREPKECFVADIAAPAIGDRIVVPLGDRRIVVFNSDGDLYGIDQGEPQEEVPRQKRLSLPLYVWDVRVEGGGLVFARCWHYSDEPAATNTSSTK